MWKINGLASSRPPSCGSRVSGIVQNVSEGVDAYVDVVIDIGCLLRARLTRKSVDQLSLSPGTPIFALVKSVALDRRSIARPVDATP